MAYTEIQIAEALDLMLKENRGFRILAAGYFGARQSPQDRQDMREVQPPRPRPPRHRRSKEEIFAYLKTVRPDLYGDDVPEVPEEVFKRMTTKLLRQHRKQDYVKKP